MKKSDLNTVIIPWFTSAYPLPKSELVFVNVYELAVSVILSAQCTDKRVNLITPALFEKYPDFLHLSEAGFDEIFGFIKSCSYPNNKTRHLMGLSKTIIEKYAGQIPEDLDEMQKLPESGENRRTLLLL